VHRRQITGLVLCGLGAALIVLAPLLHWWVGPSLIKSPIGGTTRSDASGENVTYLDFADPNKRQQTGTVRSRDVYQGIDKDSTDNVAVYELSSEIYFTDEPDLALDISASKERFAIDRKTGMTVPDPKGKEKIDNDVNNQWSRHSGLIVKFPLDTEKKDYPFWDSQIRSSEFPMQFRGEQTLEGLKVYRFEQTIPDTDLSAQTANLHYASERVAWVEPTTGVIVKGQQTVKITLGAPSDPNKATVLDGTLTFTDQNIKASAQKAKDGRAKVALIKLYLPLVCLLLGVVILVVGLLLTRGAQGAGEPAAHGRPRRRGGAHSDEPTATFPVQGR
jgi:hypothetical protein